MRCGGRVGVGAGGGGVAGGAGRLSAERSVDQALDKLIGSPEDERRPGGRAIGHAHRVGNGRRAVVVAAPGVFDRLVPGWRNLALERGQLFDQHLVGRPEFNKVNAIR